MDSKAPITVSWDEDVPHILVYRFVGQWTWAQYLEAFQVELALVKAANPTRYDVIADVTQSGRLPLSGAFHIKNTFEQSPNSMGILVVVTKNGLMRAFADACMRLYPILRESIVVVPTLTLAREHILRVRQPTSTAAN
jgi:hypothetical protein